ncbi:MAG: Phage-related minor tail protein [Candidatus Methanofastidiosum methylothiophilum]|uniref:Phage-related minor tail protein n=1 Tax=Candidatus Methanofastidiosum methylothiophilum TaxID=1705564 RepID=A0A150ISK2_9EURY|nr:MAG: Phage-related minor tail protein [Candidatus Methanofastidiosum methylthiophilus]KYC53564.1 MAG: Phage-related minor tail protein [Candidatus Methanofastidiosum methylthiophilus]
MLTEALTVRVGADLTDFNTKMSSLGSSVSNLGLKIAKVGAIATAAFSGIGLAAVKRFAEVDQSIREITSLMDNVSKDTVPNLTKQVKTLSVEFGKQKETIAKAQYNIVSAGFRNIADSSEVLRASLKLSTAGLADVGETADVVTSILNSYKLEAKNATKVSDILFQTVKYGKTTLPELAASIGQVLPAATAAKVSLEEVGAAMALTTVQGISTSESATALKGAIYALAAPTPEAAKRMDELGIKTKDTAGNMLPLLDVVKQFQGMSLDAIRKLIPEKEAANAVLIMANNYDTLRQNVEGMVGSAGAAQKAFEEMARSPQMRLNQLKERLDNIMVTLGEAFLPVAEKLLARITPLIDKFTDWISKNSALIAQIGEIAVVSVGLIAGMGALGKAGFFVAGALKDVFIIGKSLLMVVGALISPVGLVALKFLAIGAALAGLGYLIYTAITDFNKFKEILAGIGNFAQDFGRVLIGAVGYAVNWVMKKIAEGINWLAENLDFLGLNKKLGITKFTEDMVGFFQTGMDASTEVLKTGLNGMSETISPIVDGIKSKITGVADAFTGVFKTFGATTVPEFTTSTQEIEKSIDNLGLKTKTFTAGAEERFNKFAYNVKEIVIPVKAVEVDLTESFKNIGTSIGENFGKGAEGAKNALKSILLTILDTIEGMILAAIAASGVKAIITFGASAFSDAIKILGAKAAFAAAKSFVASKFHSGGIVGNLGSRPDEVPALLLSGESVLNRSATSLLGEKTITALNDGRITPVKSGDNIYLSFNNDIKAGNPGVVTEIERAVYKALETLQNEGKIEKVVKR